MSNSTKIIGIGVLVALGVTYQLQHHSLVAFAQGNQNAQNNQKKNISEGQRPPIAEVQISNENDFDFLMNKHWTITNKVLTERLVDSREWETFESNLSNYQKIVGGFGNIDKYYGRRQGKYFEANSIRIYHPGKKTWTIYWVDNMTTQLTYQVEGTFTNGTGTFYGQEEFAGRMVKLRFIWSDITSTSARWEQAYFDEKKEHWEVNWIMEFKAEDTRLDSGNDQ